MRKSVTIGIPVYRRLEYLPNVLQIVEAQDHPDIELLVSDNGMNGWSVPEIVKRHYSKPFSFRKNASTVGLSKHFNQIVEEASGEYFLLLADDDEISPNYVSELVSRLERHSQASVAISKQEIINEVGIKIRQSKEALPDVLSGPDFIRDTWQSYKYGFQCFATFVAKTQDIKACGGYPDFKKGSHNDNALLIKLSLNRHIVFSPKCSFRWRVYNASHGWSISIWDLAADSRQFLQFLDSDPRIVEFSSKHPADWKELKAILVKMAWETYFNRWRSLYRQRLNLLPWIATAFAIPPIPAYYRKIASTLLQSSKVCAGGWVKSLFR